MKKETRTIFYDEDLKLEAYELSGFVKSFPNHFHDHYVIGFIESGNRKMNCKNREYSLESGDIVLFNPGENHGCIQDGQEGFSYKGINVPIETMRAVTIEITGSDEAVQFLMPSIKNEEVSEYISKLFALITVGANNAFEKDECFVLMMNLLLQQYCMKKPCDIDECREEIQLACNFMEEHYMESISLERLCKITNLSKSTLLRSFTKNRGITPYRYLETVRINKAKKLLEAGETPLEAALQTGFSDQSHFTNFFTTVLGIAPGAYRNIFKR